MENGEATPLKTKIWNRSMAILLTPALFIAAVTYFSFAQAGFNYEALVQLIKTSKVRTIDDLLPLLPLSLRSSFTMMETAAGGQFGDSTDPRIIMFDVTNRLVVTFNGNPQHAGYDSLEIMQYREETERFELRRITFPKSGSSSEIDFSRANPTECLGCHGGEDPRPNWLHYNIWKNQDHTTFGFDDDYIHPQERAAFEAFMKKRESHPRYQHLAPLEGHPDSPFQTRGWVAKTQFRPNYRISTMFSRLNARRLVRKFAESANPDLYSDLFWHISTKGATPANLNLLSAKGIITNDTRSKIQNMNKEEAGAAALVAVLTAAGMSPSDWEMTFKTREWPDPKVYPFPNLWGYNDGLHLTPAWVRILLLQNFYRVNGLPNPTRDTSLDYVRPEQPYTSQIDSILSDDKFIPTEFESLLENRLFGTPTCAGMLRSKSIYGHDRFMNSSK